MVVMVGLSFDGDLIFVSVGEIEIMLCWIRISRPHKATKVQTSSKAISSLPAATAGMSGVRSSLLTRSRPGTLGAPWLVATASHARRHKS